MDILADLHTHTNFSLHAYGTVDENAKTAKQNGMEYVAITDHYYQFSDRFMQINEFSRMSELSKVKPENGATIIAGGEFNIAHKLLSTIDTDRIYKNIKWRPVGLHSWFIDLNLTPITVIPSLFANTIVSNEYVTPTTFAHIERGLRSTVGGKEDDGAISALRHIVQIAIEKDIYLELNEESFKNPDNVMLLKWWVPYAVKNGAKFSLGTDAHSRENVGVFTNVKQFIEDINIPADKILNYDRCKLQELV